MKVRFSILISAYNRAELTRQAIDSALAQTFKDYEVVVIDDGSTDHVPQVLEAYGTRIKAFRQPNRGVEAALNQAAALAHGEYLCMLDNDDLFFSHTLATYDQIIRSCDSPPLVLGAFTEFEGDQSPSADSHMSAAIKVREYPDYLSKDEPINITLSKIVIRRSLFDEVGGFGTKGGTPTDSYLDYNLMLKAGTHGPCIVVQEPCTLARRLHATNFVRDFNKVTDGILSLARSERQGLYPGGQARRGGRYAVIGGFAFWWATTRFLRTTPRLAFRVLWETAPMIPVAIWRRVSRGLREPSPPIVLPAPEL
jgi:glycosyltransferase involved in cell wall biosynthesis